MKKNKKPDAGDSKREYPPVEISIKAGRLLLEAYASPHGGFTYGRTKRVVRSDAELSVFDVELRQGNGMPSEIARNLPLTVLCSASPNNAVTLVKVRLSNAQSEEAAYIDDPNNADNERFVANFTPEQLASLGANASLTCEASSEGTHSGKTAFAHLTFTVA